MNGGRKPEGGNILFRYSYWIFFLKTEFLSVKALTIRTDRKLKEQANLKVLVR